KFYTLTRATLCQRRISARKPAALTAFCRLQTRQRRHPWYGYRLLRLEKRGLWAAGALPRGNRVFERLGILLVDELQREAFIEISHHARLDLAEHDQRFQRRAVFRGDGGA